MRKENQIDEKLFHESNAEEGFQLDNEDISFQEGGFKKIESKLKNANPFEVISEPPEKTQVKVKSNV